MNFLKRFFKREDVYHPPTREFLNKKTEENQLIMKQKVDDYFAYLLTVYNNYVDDYNKNKAIRELLNKETEIEAYIRNIDNGIRLTGKAMEQIKSAPYVYQLPKSIQQYLSASKTQFLLSLEHHLKRDEVIKQLLTNQKNLALTMDDANAFLAKSDQHLNSAMHYMDTAREIL
ncbi:hypothetical protein R4Z10_11310 [Niallia sp. XMNu-256]|uniref:hypothetical protein n=1 Tax=Niallia sp. XMNu-256 TaxID=3082444 RepID=UPI0030CF442A